MDCRGRRQAPLNLVYSPRDESEDRMDERPQAASPPQRSKEGDASPRAKSVGPPSEAGFDGGKYCVETMSQHLPGPAQPIHFSYKKNESDGSAKDFEATRCDRP